MLRLATDMAAMEAMADLTEDMDVPMGDTVDTGTERGKLMLMQAMDMEDMEAMVTLWVDMEAMAALTEATPASPPPPL